MDSQHNQSNFAKQLQEIQELRRQQFLRHKAQLQKDVIQDVLMTDTQQQNASPPTTTQDSTPYISATPTQNEPTAISVANQSTTEEQEPTSVEEKQNENDEIPFPTESQILVKIASLESPIKDIELSVDPRSAPVMLKRKISVLYGNRQDTLKLIHPTTKTFLEDLTPLYQQRVTNKMTLFCKYHPPGARSNGIIESKSCQLVRLFVKKRNLSILKSQPSNSTSPQIIELDKRIEMLRTELLSLRTTPQHFPTIEQFEKVHALLLKLQIIDEKKLIYIQNRGKIEVFSRYSPISSLFGVFPGNVIRTAPKGDAVAVGILNDELWFKIVADYGATYWNNVKDYATVFSVLQPKLLAWNGIFRQESGFIDIMNSFLSPLIQERDQLLKTEFPTDNMEVEFKSNETPGQLTIDDIPDHLMISFIFAQLDTFYERATISLVCKRWNTLVDDESLWHDIDFCLQTHITSEKFSQFITKKGHCIRTLCVQNCRGLHEASWVTVAAHCPNLEELNVCNTAFDNNAFSYIATSCPNMKALWLIDTLVDKNGFDAEASWSLKEVHIDCSEEEVTDMLQTLALSTVESFYFRQQETRGWIVIKHGELGKPHKIQRDSDQTVIDLKVLVSNLYGARLCDQWVPFMTNADISVGDEEFLTHSINPFSVWVIVTDQK